MRPYRFCQSYHQIRLSIPLPINGGVFDRPFAFYQSLSSYIWRGLFQSDSTHFHFSCLIHLRRICCRLRALLIDLSGTLHVDSTPTKDAANALKRLRSNGIVLRFVSNTSKESSLFTPSLMLYSSAALTYRQRLSTTIGSSLLDKMRKMQLDVREDEVSFDQSPTFPFPFSRQARNPDRPFEIRGYRRRHSYSLLYQPLEISSLNATSSEFSLRSLFANQELS